AGGRVPDPDGVVVARRGQLGAVRAERHTRNASGVAGEGQGDLAATRVPDLHYSGLFMLFMEGPRTRRRGDLLIVVGAEGHTPDGVGVPPKRIARLAGGRIPEPDGRVFTGRGEQRAIAIERHTRDLFAVPGEGKLQLAGR